MTDSGPYVDPQAIALLQEVALDPKSSLLKIERPRAFAAAAGMGKDVLARSLIGLTSAEKDLLAVYRDEVAYLLRVAYDERLRREPAATARGFLDLEPRVRADEFGEDEIARRLAEASANHALALEPSMSTAIAAVSDPKTSMYDLAALSLRFSPSVSGTSYLIEELRNCGQHESAKLACQILLSQPMAPFWRGLVVQKLSNACASLDDLQSSLDHQARQLAGGSLDMIGGLNAGYYALILADAGRASEAMRYLDSHWSSTTPMSQSWIRQMSIQEYNSSRSWTRASLALARSLERSAGPVAGVLLGFITQCGDKRR